MTCSFNDMNPPSSDIGLCVAVFMANLENGSVVEGGFYAGMSNLSIYDVERIIEQLIDHGAIERRHGRLALPVREQGQ